jgi:pyruvate/2-oxoglutarate/acetoin dehydrogenase E1 component
MRFAAFPSNNYVLSNAAKIRLQSNHVVGVPMEIRIPMTRCDGASEFSNLNEGIEQHLGCQRRTPQARGPAVAAIKSDLQLNSNDAA